MKQYFLIENSDDISLFLRQRESIEDVVCLTPSVHVAWELTRKDICVRRMGFGEWRDELVELDSQNRDNVIILRETIADYLNGLEGYAFKGCHHPDFLIYPYKRILFSFVYRYAILYKILELERGRSDKTIVSMVDDSGAMGGRLKGTDDLSIYDSFFPYGQRGFSNILKWSRGDLIRSLVVVSEPSSGPVSPAVRRKEGIGNGVLHDTYARLSAAFYNVKCRLLYHGDPVALVDLLYLNHDSLCVADGVRLYALRRHLLENSFRKFRESSRMSEVEDVVSRVDRDVLGPMGLSGLFRIHDFDYHEYVRGVLKSFIRTEVAALFWAESQAGTLGRMFKVEEAHSDAAFNPPMYALFALLKRSGTNTFSYPHGAEGFYDYFWQERLTTAAASWRVVGSDAQKIHFEDQQRRHYREDNRTRFMVHPIRFRSDTTIKLDAESKRFDVVYVMNEIVCNHQYTVINYPDEFDQYDSQKAIISALCDIAKERGLNICIRPSNNSKINTCDHLFSNISEDVSIAWDKRFPDILPLCDKVIMDSPTTALFQCFEHGKKVLCLNCVNSADDNLKRILLEHDVRYIEARIFHDAEVRVAIREYLGG